MFKKNLQTALFSLFVLLGSAGLFQAYAESPIVVDVPSGDVTIKDGNLFITGENLVINEIQFPGDVFINSPDTINLQGNIGPTIQPNYNPGPVLITRITHNFDPITTGDIQITGGGSVPLISALGAPRNLDTGNIIGSAIPASLDINKPITLESSGDILIGVLDQQPNQQKPTSTSQTGSSVSVTSSSNRLISGGTISIKSALVGKKIVKKEETSNDTSKAQEEASKALSATLAQEAIPAPDLSQAAQPVLVNPLTNTDSVLVNINNISEAGTITVGADGMIRLV